MWINDYLVKPYRDFYAAIAVFVFIMRRSLLFLAFLLYLCRTKATIETTKLKLT